MELYDASLAFASLGHPGRLAVLRLLMRFAPHPARPTEIAAALAMKPNTLSHHLADLVACGLVQVTRHGRSLHYAADLAGTRALLGYLALDLGRARPDLLTQLTPREAPAMSDRIWNVLFLCSGNSARSILAEALLRDLGGGRFAAHSAGTRPGSQVNPVTLEVLARNGHDTAGLRSKHLSVFQAEDAPVMDFVFTVCDTAASEDCPLWPGQPLTGHWGLPDPVKAQGTPAEKALAFAQTYGALRRRITAFAALPFDSLSRLSLQARIDAIGTETLTDQKV